MEQFTVQLNNATCTVCIGAGVLGRAGALLRQHVPQVRRWALAADENASALYGEWVQSGFRAAGLQVRLFLLPQGESAKTPEAWLSLCRRILDSGFDRSCGVVTLGGGACGDAAGLWPPRRCCGACRWPISPPRCLPRWTAPWAARRLWTCRKAKTCWVRSTSRLWCCRTLPAWRRCRSGSLPPVWRRSSRPAWWLTRHCWPPPSRACGSDSGEALTALVAACGRAKLHLVSGDAEDHGARRLLNFGHTFGHGYEAVGGYDTWTHGEAVAAGMCRTLRWQIANGYGGTDVLARLEPLLTRYGLPTAIDCDEAALRRCVGHDKKTAGGTVQLVIVRRMGQGELVTVPLSDLWEDKA